MKNATDRSRGRHPAEPMRHILLAIALAIAAGCSENASTQTTFDEAKRQGDYQLVATTTVGVDRVDVWQQLTGSGEADLGAFLIAAVSPSGEVIDFRSGQFVIKRRPFFQDSRYVALMAGSGLDEERATFFVYDARSRKFLVGSVDELISGCGVHDNILVVEDVAFFASCKTPTPLGRLDLKTGEVTTFGLPAPQGASFYVVGSDVLVKGSDQRVYRIDEEELVEVDTQIHKDHISEAHFDAIVIDEGGKNRP